MKNQGLIHVYTGDGKGKTTASVGLGMRAAGRDFKVVMVQFLKSSDTGELKVIEKLDNFEVHRFERPRGFFWTLNDKEKLELQEDIDKAIQFVKDRLESGDCDLLILDEVMGSIKNKLIDVDKLVSMLKNRKPHMEVVLTGRNVPAEIVEIADYVSEINPIKHPFEKGIPARRGIED